MLKRRLILAAFVCALVLTLKAIPAHAQEPTYFTYVSEWAVPRGQWAAFEKERDQQNATLGRLVADGTLVAWGSDRTYVHAEEGYTHEDWLIATSRANILKALETLRAGATGPAFASVTKHRDSFLHTLAHGGKTSSGATGYLRVAAWQAKPGEAEALEAHVMKYIKPVLDADVASGAILMYNFDVEDVHTDAPGLYDLAAVYPNAEAIDKFFADLAARSKENPAVGQTLQSLTVQKEHRDDLSRVTSYQHK